VTLVVPYAPGTALEPALRLAARRFQDAVGVPLVVDYKPGGSGNIAAQAVAKAPPTGHTLLLGTANQFAINPHTFDSLPYDPQRDFVPVAGFVGGTMVLAIHPGIPTRSLAGFIAWAKTAGERASYASFTAGSSSHFAGVMLNARAGLSMVHIPFNGSNPAVQNLVGGQVSAAFVPTLAVKPFHDTRRVVALATTGAKGSSFMPRVQTFTAAGYPEMEIALWCGVFAPTRTPERVVRRLGEVFVTELSSSEATEQLEPLDLTPMPMPPQRLAEYVRAESQRWGTAVRLSGFKNKS
jgi:tripartite-type tricarboxylate transporter receptor subunit TctC